MTSHEFKEKKEEEEIKNIYFTQNIKNNKFLFIQSILAIFSIKYKIIKNIKLSKYLNIKK